MRPIVGLYCVHCGRRIDDVTEGHFCDSCACPIHLGCASPAAGGKTGTLCSTCAAKPEQAKREEGLLQEIQQKRDADIDPHNIRGRIGYLAGVIIFGFMAIRSLSQFVAWSIDPLFVVGLLGAGICLALFLWSRPPKP